MSAPVRRLTIKEIIEQDRAVTLTECLKAFYSGATFEFGVDRTEIGLRLTINLQIIGIYLCPNVDVFRSRVESPYEAVIVPNTARAGRIEHDEDGNNVVIHISPGDHRQFCADAQSVYELYSLKDFCFRGIPDVWFRDLMLVQFLRDALRPHPSMGRWFGSNLHGTGILWLSRRLGSPEEKNNYVPPNSGQHV